MATWNKELLPRCKHPLRFAHHDKALMDFLGVEILSKDIGEYNTCPHLCEYCYANASKEVAVRNYKEHNRNPLGETITGIIK